MTKRNFLRYLTRLHKWAGLVLGVQILLWFVSGFIMSLFPINEVRGRHLVDVPKVSLQTENLIPLELAMSLYEGELSGAKLITAAGHSAYVLIGDNDQQIIDAVTGEPWSQLSAEDIKAVADRLYKGDGEIRRLELSLIHISEPTRPY